MTNYKCRCHTIDVNTTHRLQPTLPGKHYSTIKIMQKKRNGCFFCLDNFNRLELKMHFLSVSRKVVIFVYWPGSGTWRGICLPNLDLGWWVVGWVCGWWECVSLQDTRTRPEGRATARHPPKQYRQGCLIKGKWFFAYHRGCLLAMAHIFTD